MAAAYPRPRPTRVLTPQRHAAGDVRRADHEHLPGRAEHHREDGAARHSHGEQRLNGSSAARWQPPQRLDTPRANHPSEHAPRTRVHTRTQSPRQAALRGLDVHDHEHLGVLFALVDLHRAVRDGLDLQTAEMQTCVSECCSDAACACRHAPPCPARAARARSGSPGCVLQPHMSEARPQRHARTRRSTHAVTASVQPSRSMACSCSSRTTRNSVEKRNSSSSKNANSSDCMSCPARRASRAASVAQRSARSARAAAHL